MFRKVKNVKGFTLIELMVVVAIIGIILAIAIPNFIAYRRSSCDTAAESDLAKVATSMEKLQTDLGKEFCTTTIVPAARVTNAFLATLATPYYGWGGTSKKCDVRIDVAACVGTGATGTCFRAYALGGSQPSGAADSRYTFQVPIYGGAALKPTTGVPSAVGVAVQFDTTKTASLGCIFD